MGNWLQWLNRFYTLSSLFYSSTSMGGSIFFWISSISGLLFIAIAGLLFKLHSTKMLSEVKKCQ